MGATMGDSSRLFDKLTLLVKWGQWSFKETIKENGLNKKKYHIYKTPLLFMKKKSKIYFSMPLNDKIKNYL